MGRGGVGEREQEGGEGEREADSIVSLSHIGSTRGSSFVLAVADMILNDLKLFLNLYLF